MKYYERNHGDFYEARETELPISELCREITEDEFADAINKINKRIAESNKGVG